MSPLQKLNLKRAKTRRPMIEAEMIEREDAERAEAFSTLLQKAGTDPNWLAQSLRQSMRAGALELAERLG